MKSTNIFYFDFFQWVFLSIILIVHFLKGRTPLMVLLNQRPWNSEIEIVLFMLKKGVEINKTNEVFHISLFLGYSLGTINQSKMVGWKYCTSFGCAKGYVGDSETFV